jgi:hypothetical protein
MEGAIKYLLQQYPNCHFSEINYLTSNVAANIISSDYSQQDAIAILYHNIYWVVNVTGGTITFNDQYNNPMFITPNSSVCASWAPIPMVRKGATVLVSASPSVIGTIPFSISFQYIMPASKI